MGAFLAKPKTEKECEHGSGNGLRFAFSCMQGWRVEMEDAHTAILGLPYGLKEWSFFAVFDGHAGARVAQYASQHLLNEITSNVHFKGTDLPTGNIQPGLSEVSAGIRTGFLNLDAKMRNLPELTVVEDKSGSTAVCIMITPTHLVFANCGDSRSILVRNGRVHFATDDHKPVKPREKERIQNAGGSVIIQRLNGSLAVSRALGDFEYKNVEGLGACEQLVSPEPEIHVEERTERDQFVVLACDGIWDVMTNEELMEFVHSRLMLTDNLEQICCQVVDTCLNKGSRDNMSIIILALQNAPKVSEEALTKEADLDTRLEEQVQAIYEEAQRNGEAKDLEVPQIMHLLSTNPIVGLPPGGGIMAKRATIEAIFHRLRPEQMESNNSASNSHGASEENL